MVFNLGEFAFGAPALGEVALEGEDEADNVL